MTHRPQWNMWAQGHRGVALGYGARSTGQRHQTKATRPMTDCFFISVVRYFYDCCHCHVFGLHKAFQTHLRISHIHIPPNVALATRRGVERRQNIFSWRRKCESLFGNISRFLSKRSAFWPLLLLLGRGGALCSGYF